MILERKTQSLPHQQPQPQETHAQLGWRADYLASRPPRGSGILATRLEKSAAVAVLAATGCSLVLSVGHPSQQQRRSLGKWVLAFLAFLGIIFNGCNSNSSSTGSNTNSDNENTDSQTIITSSIYEGDFYFDLLNGVETDSNSLWQISFQNKTINYECTQEDVETEFLCTEIGQTLQFSMPSVVLGDVHAAAMYDLDYDNLDSYPDTFITQDSPMFDHLSVEYGGENVIIMYDMSTHQVSLSESILLIYSLTNHSVFKIKFNESEI